MAEIQANSQSPVFFRLVEGGDRRCQSDWDMGIPTVTDTQNIDPASDDKTGADPNTLLMCLLLWILWRYWI